MTGVKPLTEFVEGELPEFVATKENPDEWYVLMGSAVGEYSVQAATMPEDYEEAEAELPPEDQDATKNVQGHYQIGTSGWIEAAFAEDCNFVGEFIGDGASKLDTRLLHMLVVHESMLSEEALDVANEDPDEEPVEAES